MDYNQIKKTIENDYSLVTSAKSGGRGMKAFYLQFSQALEELHLAVGPFITSKEQFIEHIKYLDGKVSKDIYDTIIQYCHDKLKLDI